MLAYQYIISLSYNFLLPCGHMVTVVTVTTFSEKREDILVISLFFRNFASRNWKMLNEI